MKHSSLLVISICATFAACGSDTASNRSGEEARRIQAEREATQFGGVRNPDVIACLNQVTTAEERAVLRQEDEVAGALLDELMRRQSMSDCLNDSNAVIYI